MPMYEYECAACGHRLETIQKFSDKPLKNCPKCKKAKLERLLSSPAIQFKGTGWYITDYARKASPETGKADKDSASSDTKTETKSDSTGDAAKDSTPSTKETTPKAAPAKSKAESAKSTAAKR
jgi:putative FmdB family regulatory protein